MIDDDEHKFLIDIYQKLNAINEELSENIESSKIYLEDNQTLAKILLKIIFEHQSRESDD